MPLYPSVVIGLGSSGCYVLSNLERILYEVAGDAPLNLFRLLSIDTDSRPKEDEPPPGGKRGISYSANVKNTGQAILNLRQSLGEDISWCPQDLTIEGEGAGNLRAGGRLLLFSHFPKIWQMIQRAVYDASTAARDGSTLDVLRQLYERRKLTPPADLVSADRPVVYMVGTLAGGTCSGMCLDLGYAIRDAAPGAERIGIFLVPGRTESPVFLENAWATLRDLEFFCDNPTAFNSVWVSENGAKQRYKANALPFDRVYLISSYNEAGILKMPYAPNSMSPLAVMASMHLAAELMGMHSHVSASHVNINNQVGTKTKNRFFINYNLRAVTYPKYDISEAAACAVIQNLVCARWLNRERYYSSASGLQAITEDDVRAVGRKLWNEQFNTIWQGLSGALDVAPLVDGIVRGTSSKPSTELHYQLTSSSQGTIYSKIAQMLPGRRLALQQTIKDGLGLSLGQSQNIRYGQLFLEGVKGELEHTVSFWNSLRTPNRNDQESWSSMARSQVDFSLQEYSSLSRLLVARSEMVADEIQNILTRLQMFLMKQVLREVQAWIDDDLLAWMQTLRTSVEGVQDMAKRRKAVLVQQVEELQGPVLRLSRSTGESLKVEIDELARNEPIFDKPLLSNSDAGYTGLFAVKSRQEAAENKQIFLALKNELQPRLLRILEEKGTVDVVKQIRDQERIRQVVTHFTDAQSMSLATRLALTKNPAALPAYVLARDVATAQEHINDLQKAMGNPPLVTPQPLPIFDHMVLFYQEGACSVQPSQEYQSIPDVLTDAPIFEEHYAAKMQERSDNLDPLAGSKRVGKGAL